MNRTRLHIALLLAIILFLLPSSRAQVVSPNHDRILMGQINSFTTTIFLLVGERFAYNESKNETWILRIHPGTDPNSLLKYRQGNIVVASLPANEIAAAGARLFATRYNLMTLQKADKLALSGNYTNALEIYRVLEQFAQGYEHTDDIKRRIDCTQKILQKQNVEKNLKTIKLMVTTSPPSTFEQLETKPAIVSTNLLTVRFPGQEEEQPAEPDEKDKEPETDPAAPAK